MITDEDFLTAIQQSYGIEVKILQQRLDALLAAGSAMALTFFDLQNGSFLTHEGKSAELTQTIAHWTLLANMYKGNQETNRLLREALNARLHQTGF